jgi:hypothetical protein
MSKSKAKSKPEVESKPALGYLFKRPRDRKSMCEWVHVACGLLLPVAAVCPGHDTPLDYLCHSFFETGATGAQDCVVWACRGGGKTTLGAVATLLDMLFKPGIQIRILAGSLEQADKMFATLSGFVHTQFAKELGGPIRRRSLELRNGSRVEVLAQSERSVRGTRVHKLRCDEVELFTREVWTAAQLVTRSASAKKSAIAPPADGKKRSGRYEIPLETRGSIEAFSTMHVPGGMMSEVVAAARAAGKKVFTWCAWDVINECPPDRACETCTLHDGCGGRAKTAEGFMRVEDLVAMRTRVSAEVWNNEVLCRPAQREDAVFAGFSCGEHVGSAPEWTRVGRRIMGVDFGYAGAFAAVWVTVTGQAEFLRAHVSAEYVRARATLAENVAAVRERTGGEWPSVVHVDPAGVAVNPQTGVSDVRVMRDAGFRVRYRRQRVEVGIAVMERMLRPAIGEIRLTVDAGCRKLIAALEGYRWKTARGGGPEKDGVHDHILDALRYALTGEALPHLSSEYRI